ncbi:MAG: sigma 54-interacting transcriptional regulator [Kofleriaceae bacterium]
MIDQDPTPAETSGRAGGSAPSPSLLLVAGAGTFSSHALDGRDLIIGRATDCDVRVDHSLLSRRHARLRVGPPATIQDLGSRNGTRVAGQTLRGGEPLTLRSNDSFHIGPFSFVLVAGRGSDTPSLSAREGLRVIDPTPAGVSSVVRDLAGNSTNVLVLGETGVGKEVLAETLHELSKRSGPLVRINCAALSETLLESELFGHEKGAFTGAGVAKAGLLEAADKGTVFLDEVGELPPLIQPKLLRAIERREVLRIGATRPIAIDVRFLAATNRDLPSEVAAGTFRRDLFFRLDGVTLVVPPLRERTELIGPLALRFLEIARSRTGSSARFAGEVLATLEQYAWPGNVRELRAVIDRAALLARGGDIDVRHLAFTQASSPTAPTSPPSVDDPAVAGLSNDERAERARIIAALEESAGNQTRAARVLGLARTTLANKLVAYRIPRPRG